jgi:hypothetical protein
LILPKTLAEGMTDLEESAADEDSAPRFLIEQAKEPSLMEEDCSIGELLINGEGYLIREANLTCFAFRGLFLVTNVHCVGTAKRAPPPSISPEFYG